MRRRKCRERVSRSLRFTAVKENGFFHRVRTAIVHEQRVSIEKTPHQSQSPEWSRSPFTSRRRAIGPAVGQGIAHVVNKRSE